MHRRAAHSGGCSPSLGKTEGFWAKSERHGEVPYWSDGAVSDVGPLSAKAHVGLMTPVTQVRDSRHK